MYLNFILKCSIIILCRKLFSNIVSKVSTIHYILTCMKNLKACNISLFKILLPALFIVKICFSHAHVFIDYKVHACITESGLEGVYVNWTFDRMFTQFIQKEFDKNEDNKLSKDEQVAIFNKFNSDYAKTDYFAVIKVDKKNYSIPKPTNFSARIIQDKGMVAYTFFLPLKLNATKKKTDVQVYFFDPVIYVAFTIMPKDVTIQNKSKTIEASISLKPVKYVNCPTISMKVRS